MPGAGPNAAHSTGQRLRDDLKTIRDQGFAVEDQEEEAGIACIAAPVLDSNGHAAAAIGATGLEHQLLHERRPTITQAVIHAAETLARRTGLRES